MPTRRQKSSSTHDDTRWVAAQGSPGISGISLSGGGIRSAAYSLGALQAMQEHGLVTGPSKVDYLSAVSGGSYIASALTMIARGPITEADRNAGVLSAADPFARGTPEEKYLRAHTTYLVHGRGGRVSMVARLLGGILLNLLFIGVAVHTLFRVIGWFYGWIFPALRLHTSTGARTGKVDIHLPVWTYAVPLAAVACGVILGLVGLAVSWNNDRVRHRLVLTCWCLIAAAAGMATITVGIPKLLELVRDVVSRWGAASAPHTQRQAAGRSSQPLAVGGGAGAAGASATGLLTLRARVMDPGTRRNAENWLLRKVRPLLPKFRTLILNTLAAIFGPMLVLVGAVLALNIGAAATPFGPGNPRLAEVLIVSVSVALFLLMHWYADLNAWSMHAIYKRRLSDAFILRRVRFGGERKIDAEPREWSQPYRLSDSQGSLTPTLLVCAAVNISDYGRTPTGSRVASFVFSANSVGGPLGEMETAQYESMADTHLRSITLPTAMSIAGAAISPSMGKMTRPPLRFLMALLNLRLGVWVPNPNLVRQSGSAPGRRKLYPERPRINYLLREMIGRNTADARFVYVSDGGHYENLGLVELLRRGCTTIWCVDASGETINTFGTIAEAIAIARSELSVDIDIDLSAMGPDPEATGAAARFVRKTWVQGTVSYQNGVQGILVVLKCGVPNDAPADVLDFHAKAKLFPCDPTSNQLYTARRFDAYRALGYTTARHALAGATGPGGSPIAPAWQPAVTMVEPTIDLRTPAPVAAKPGVRVRSGPAHKASAITRTVPPSNGGG